MTINDLKEMILQDSLSNSFLIFRCTKPARAKARPDSFFLANQYIDEICSRRNLVRNNITSIGALNESALSLVFNFASELNVLSVPVFDEQLEDYSELENVIVVCNEIDSRLEAKVSEYIIDFKPANDWQTIAYMQAICPGLSEESYTWLYQVTDGDLNRITNELDKLTVFEPASRAGLLQELKFDQNTDLYTLDYFDLINSIMSRKLMTIYEYLSHQKLFDFEAIGLTNILLANYKKLLYVRFGNSSILDNANISQKQAYAINKNYPNYTKAELLKNIKFLSNIDNRLKSNELELDKDALISYIICNLL